MPRESGDPQAFRYSDRLPRDEATDASDLDLLVDFAERATFDGFMGLKFFLEVRSAFVSISRRVRRCDRACEIELRLRRNVSRDDATYLADMIEACDRVIESSAGLNAETLRDDRKR